MPYTNATGTAAVVVSVPAGAGVPHAYLFNNSTQVAYLGGSAVTTVSGFPLYPNCRADLANMPGTVWAVAPFAQSTSIFGTVVTNVAQAGSTVTINADPAWVIGTSAVIEPGTVRQEIVTIGGTTSTGVTLNTPVLFAHGSVSSLIYAVTPYVTTVQAARGAT